MDEKQKAIDWYLNCPNCGFEFSITFDSNESEENKTIIRTCPCGTVMGIVKERVYDGRETEHELVFTHDNGEEEIIDNKLFLGTLDNITRQALIPFFAEAIVNAGYGDLRAFAKSLKEEFADGIEKYYAVDKVLNEFLGGEK